MIKRTEVSRHSNGWLKWIFLEGRYWFVRANLNEILGKGKSMVIIKRDQCHPVIKEELDRWSKGIVKMIKLYKCTTLSYLFFSWGAYRLFSGSDYYK